MGVTNNIVPSQPPVQDLEREKELQRRAELQEAASMVFLILLSPFQLVFLSLLEAKASLWFTPVRQSVS